MADESGIARAEQAALRAQDSLDQFNRDDDLALLGAAIELLTEALALAPAHPDAPTWTGGLFLAHGERAVRCDSLADFNQCITYGSRCLSDPRLPDEDRP